MPRQQHYYGENHLHYLTRSTYRRTRLFDSEKFRRRWVETLGDLRAGMGFKIAGYVLMPEHFHLLIWPTPDADPSQILQKLEGRAELFILRQAHNNATRQRRSAVILSRAKDHCSCIQNQNAGILHSDQNDRGMGRGHSAGDACVLGFGMYE